MSSYARLLSFNSAFLQTTGQINLKVTRETLAELEVFEEASTTYEFLVSEAPSRTNLKTDYRNIILEIETGILMRCKYKQGLYTQERGD